MRILFLATLLSSSLFVQAQSINRQLLGSQGAVLEQELVVLSFSVGEPVAGLLSMGEIQLSGGYHQALDLNALSIEDFDLSIGTFYPNPTTAFIRISTPSNDMLRMSISDLTGQIVLQKEVSKTQQINVKDLVQGNYILRLYNPKTKKQNTYKLIKK